MVIVVFWRPFIVLLWGISCDLRFVRRSFKLSFYENTIYLLSFFREVICSSLNCIPFKIYFIAPTQYCFLSYCQGLSLSLPLLVSLSLSLSCHAEWSCRRKHIQQSVKSISSVCQLINHMSNALIPWLLTNFTFFVGHLVIFNPSRER